MIPFPDKKYQVLYADPPWYWKTYSSKGEGRSAKNHYPVMTLQDIKNLPVQSISEDDSILFLWVLNSMLKEGIELGEKWGFKYKTVGFAWTKTNKDNSIFKGLGYYTRQNTELCLIFRKGKGLKRVNKSIPTAVLAPRGKHSEKPAIIREYIEELYGDVSRIELFARTKTNGWDVWGNEV